MNGIILGGDGDGLRGGGCGGPCEALFLGLWGGVWGVLVLCGGPCRARCGALRPEFPYSRHLRVENSAFADTSKEFTRCLRGYIWDVGWWCRLVW